LLLCEPQLLEDPSFQFHKFDDCHAEDEEEFDTSVSFNHFSELANTGKWYKTGVITCSESSYNNIHIVLISDIMSYGESSVVPFQYLSAHN